MRKVVTVSKYSKYERLSRIFRLIVIALLIIFAIVMLIFGRKYLTSANFKFFAKNMSVEPFVTKENYTDIKYDNYYGTQFYSYDDKIAINDNNEIFVYSPSGTLINKLKVNKDTKVNTEGKYICVYDSTRCVVYNSFSEMLNFSSPMGEIISGVKSDNSNFITMTTQGNANASAVKVYMNNFGLIYEWRSNDKYAVSTSIQESGKAIAILSKTVENGSDAAYLTVANIKNGEILHTEIFEDEIPIEVRYSGTRITLVTNKCVRFCTDKDYAWNSDSIRGTYEGCYVFDNCICTVSINNYGNRLVNIFSLKGNSVGYSEYDYKIVDIKEASGNLYLISADGSVFKQSGSDKETLISDSQIRSLLDVNDVIYYVDGEGCHKMK